MTRIVTTLLLLGCLGCQDPNAPIRGHWSVDQEATLAMATARDAVWLNRYLQPLTDGLKVEFTNTSIYIRSLDTAQRTSAYSVIDSSDDGLTLLVTRESVQHRVTVVFRDDRVVLAENDQAVVLRRQ